MVRFPCQRNCRPQKHPIYLCRRVAVVTAIAIAVAAIATMTRDSAAVCSLDDRRRRCSISAASSVADDGLSPTTKESGNNGRGDERASFNSSSTVSTTTSCSSRSCSDDDDSATRLVDVSENAKALHDLTHAIVCSNGDKNSSNSSNFNDTSTADAATNIGGRLTFYKGNAPT